MKLAASPGGAPRLRRSAPANGDRTSFVAGVSYSPEIVMPTYTAFLRGVNVGQNLLRMERLREVCSRIGMKNVRTYVQSGNVVFEAEGTAEKWAQALERKLAGETRLPVTVLVRAAAEMKKVLGGNPFLKEKGIDTTRLAVVFLQQAPSKATLDQMRAVDIGNERFECAGREIYIHCPDGFAKTKLYSLDKLLGQRTTTRNWNTVTKLCAMCES
jgi:uncharacterized protein (DUF1697 family)